MPSQSAFDLGLWEVEQNYYEHHNHQKGPDRPSPATISTWWDRIQNDAMEIERRFVHIAQRLKMMRQMEHYGFVNIDELEQAEEWHELRSKALPLLFGRNRYGVFLDEYYRDGAGI